MKQHKWILFILILFSRLAAEDLFKASVYLKDSDPPQLLFLHHNEILEFDEGMKLRHYYLHPDSTVSVLDEVILQQNEFLRSRSEFYDVLETGEIVRYGDLMKMRFTDNGRNKEAVFPWNPDILLGPLFNDFILKNWEKLTSGQKVDFFLPAPDILKIASFNIQEDLNNKYVKNGMIVFKMNVSSIFLKLLVRPSYFVYDLSSSRLQSIHGTTILRSKVNNKWQRTTDVDIYYQYKD
ncbi:MAG: hypothetical protein JW996_01935 [Candidatus Cloacimonetes bacterium]|nr:hypothetical protein [Candidatus Cloacimonadota bacterium]